MPVATPLPLSIYLICKNEADRLGPTLQAVDGLGREIIVVDSGSTDATKSVAEAHGARVVLHPFEGYGPQKRFAEDQCSEPWLFNLDADEVVSEELRRELIDLFASGDPAKDAFEIPIAEVFPGMERPHRFAYSLAPVRLYRASVGRYSKSPVHDRVDLKAGAKVGRTRARVHHFSVRSMGEQIGKLNRYTDMQVEDLFERGRQISPLRLIFEFPIQFLKAYFLRRHCFYGLYGIATAVNVAYARHLRIAKYVEQVRIKKTHGDGFNT